MAHWKSFLLKSHSNFFDGWALGASRFQENLDRSHGISFQQKFQTSKTQ
jgi:hypothetical protein